VSERRRSFAADARDVETRLWRPHSELGNARAVSEYAEYQWHAEQGADALDDYIIASYFDFDSPQNRALIQARSSRRRCFPVLAELLPLGVEAATVEVGCGLGRYLALLRRRGARLAVGVDLSFRSLKQCRRVFAKRFGSIPPVCVADGRRLPFAACTFDRGLCTDVLEHIASAADQSAVVSELVRVTKRDSESKVVLQTPNAVRVAAGVWFWRLVQWSQLRSAKWIQAPFSGRDGGHVVLRRPGELRAITEDGIAQTPYRAAQMYSASWIDEKVPMLGRITRILLRLWGLRDLVVDRCLFTLSARPPRRSTPRPTSSMQDLREKRGTGRE
jgi:SAM-dependent methyltransferase